MLSEQRQINGLLSKCLIEPDFLESLESSNAESLRDFLPNGRILDDFRSMDSHKVKQIAGFVTRIQHNFLWDVFPLARRVLDFFELETDVFSKYVTQHQRLRRTAGVSRDDKAVAFLDFLQEYLFCFDSRLYDLVVHERTEWNVRRKAAQAGVSPVFEVPHGSSTKEFNKWRLAFRGPVILRQFQHNPVALVEAATTSLAKLQHVQPQPTNLVYWLDTDANLIRLLDVDVHSHGVFGIINGKRTVRTVIDKSRAQHEELTANDVRSLLYSSIELGLLTDGRRRRGSQ